MIDSNNSKNIQNLLSAFIEVEGLDEIKEFLNDLCSVDELKEFANRWLVAKLLSNKVPYIQITEQTGMSSTTIARISKCLNRENSGYRTILNKIK
jgi:TrpR-related protein YerC/YecD